MEESLAELRFRCKNLEEENEKIKLQFKTLEEENEKIKLQCKTLEEGNEKIKLQFKTLEEDKEKIKIRLHTQGEVLSTMMAYMGGSETHIIKPQDDSAISRHVAENNAVLGDAPQIEPTLKQERQPVMEGDVDAEEGSSEHIGVSQNAQYLLLTESSNNECVPIGLMGEMGDNQHGQSEKLRHFLPEIVNEVRSTPHLLNLMVEDLGKDIIDQITAKSIEADKTLELVNAVQRRLYGGCEKAYKTFQKILGGLYPKLFQTLFDRTPSKEESDFCIQPFRNCQRNKLKEQKEHGTDSKVDLPQDLDENFVHLRVVESAQKIHELKENNASLYSDYQQQLQQERSEPRFINIKDILKQGNSEISKYRSMVVGRAGIGETTTVQWLSRQWALGEWADNMVLCFVIQLRVLFACAPKSMTLLQLLTKYSTCSVEDYDLPANWFRNNQGEGVLVMVDGLDEIAVMVTLLNTFDRKNSVTDVTTEDDPKRLILNLIQGMILPNCTLICTSRPFLGLPNIICNCQMYEILGLTTNGVKEYVLKKYPEKNDEIQSVLVQNPVLLSVCSITFYCTQVTKHLNNDSNLSDKEVATYSRLQSYILKQYASRKDTDLDDRIDDKYYFPKLAKLAYNGIFACKLDDNLPKIVFTHDDLYKVGLETEEVKKSCKKGILTCTGPCYEFFHLSVQELLSCIYILTSSDIDQETMETIFDKMSKEGSLNMTLLYIFGLCFDRKDIAIKEYFPNMTGLSKHTEGIGQKLWEFLDKLVKFTNTFHECQTVLQLCQIVHETQSPAVADHVVETVVRDEEVHFERQNLTALDIKALLFTCHGLTTLKRIKLSQCNLEDSSFSQIAKYLSSNTVLTSLDLSGNQVQGPGLRALGEMLAVNDSLLCLQLEKNKIKDEEAQWLVQGLETNTSLTQLSLNENLISDDTAIGIAKCLAGCHSWERIDLRSNLIGQKGVQALIENSTHLKPKSIRLDKYNVHKNHFDACSEAIDFYNPSLENYVLYSKWQHPDKVILDDINLQDSDVEELTSILSEEQDLLELSLCNNPGLTNDSLSKLSEIAFASPGLMNIHVEGSGIDIPKENSILHFLLAMKLSKYDITLFEEGLSVFIPQEHSDYMTHKKRGVKIGYQKTGTTTEDIRSFSNLIHKVSILFSDILPLPEAWHSLTCLALHEILFKSERLKNIALCLKRLKMSLQVLEIHQEADNNCMPHYFFGDYFKEMNLKVPLTTLSIGEIRLSNDEFKSIIQALKSKSNLKHLRFCEVNELPDLYAEEFGAALSENTVLQSLSLCRSFMSDRGIALICKGLLKNKTLQHLDLGNNFFMRDAVVDATNLINSSSSLISINICHVDISRRLKYLRDALRRTKHLKYIGLPNMPSRPGYDVIGNMASAPHYDDMGNAVMDAITKGGIEKLHGETPHSLLFPDSPEGFHFKSH